MCDFRSGLFATLRVALFLVVLQLIFRKILFILKGKTMINVQISDELYDKLKNFVPFKIKLLTSLILAYIVGITSSSDWIKILKYLRQNDIKRYREIISKLGLRK